MEWQHSSSPCPKKACTSTRVRKIILTCFFDIHGPLLVEWLLTGTTITAATYCATLQKLRQIIQNCYCYVGLSSCMIMLVLIYGMPNIVTTIPLGGSQTPPYSPDLLPCDYHIFSPLKKSLRDSRFANDNEAQTANENWIYNQPHSFFAQGNHRLIDCWDTCFNLQGDFAKPIFYVCITSFFCKIIYFNIIKPFLKPTVVLLSFE